MSVLVYAISRDDGSDAAASGVQGIRAAGLRALTATVDGPLTVDRAALIRYEEAVEAAMRHRTVLPMRFGSIVEDEHQVRELLRSRASEFRVALVRLDGMVEFGVQAWAGDHANSTPPASGSATAGDGGSYMRARLAEHRSRRELQAWLESGLGEIVRERVYRSAHHGPGAVSAAYLVDRREQDAFLQRIEMLDHTGGHALSWSGPWPPYTFVDGPQP
jgi:hypothetical protein